MTARAQAAGQRCILVSQRLQDRFLVKLKATAPVWLKPTTVDHHLRHHFLQQLKIMEPAIRTKT
jgi:hypothetical protein